MPNFDWTHAIFTAIGAAIGAITGLVGGTWRVARIEPAIRLELQQDMAIVENDVRNKIDTAEAKLEAKIDEAMHMFGETVSGIREKVNEVERDMIRDFVQKEYFEQIRRENREDFGRMDEKLDKLLARR